MILIAVVLIGLLTAVIFSTSNTENATIDDETLTIRASEVQRYAAEIERAVMYIASNGKSEADIRFAHPDAPSDYGDLSADADKSDQVFHGNGGGAQYKTPPDGINDGSSWEFYGGTALPGVGSAKADLIAVLPNVTTQFCARINKLAGQSGTPADTGGALASGASAGNCLNMGSAGRFGSTYTFYATPNTTDTTTFEQDPETSGPRPALEGCVRCSADGKDHFFHVLMAR